MFLAGNNVKRLSPVSHTINTIHLHQLISMELPNTFAVQMQKVNSKRF